MKHDPMNPWCDCHECNWYICHYCGADIGEFQGTTEEGETLCQECFYTSGDFDDWEHIPDQVD